jgi:phospholipid/cholesterol/gamma-HCH transport system substrate-binding protein
MKFRVRYAEQIAGAFVLLGIGVLAAVLVLMGMNQRWFARDYFFSTRFASGAGVSTGMAVTLKGFQIGHVDRVELAQDNTVTVSLRIYDTYYQKITPNSVIEHTSNPLGIGGGLVLHPGKVSATVGEIQPLADGSHIPSLDFSAGRRLVESGLVAMPESEDIVTSLVADVQRVLGNLDGALVGLGETLVVIKEGLSGQGDSAVARILGNAEAATAGLAGSVDAVDAQIAGIVESLNRTTATLQEATANVRSATAAMADPTGLVTTLLDPKGSLATLLDDGNRLYERIDDALQDIETASADVREFALFMKDTAPAIKVILEDGREVIREGKAVVESVSNNALIRGGIPQAPEQPAAFQSMRDEDF